MTRIVFLIPPSEGKKGGGEEKEYQSKYSLPLALKIAKHVTSKDIKCSGKRFSGAQELHKNIEKGPFMKAIERYSGEMFTAIGYENFSPLVKKFFDTHFLIVSGLYGLVAPQDCIANYKLPVEAQGVVKFWGNTLSTTLLQNYDIIIDLLPESYRKLFDIKLLHKQLVRVDFYTDKTREKKLGHGVKKIKGGLIHKICHTQELSLENIAKIHIKGTYLQISTYDKTATPRKKAGASLFLKKE